MIKHSKVVILEKKDRADLQSEIDKEVAKYEEEGYELKNISFSALADEGAYILKCYYEIALHFQKASED